MAKRRFVTKSANSTRKLGEILGEETRGYFNRKKTGFCVSLEGELGSGKTVFAKGFARGLGIKEEMKSPTFILMRVFHFRGPTPTSRRSRTSRFFHIDAYRDQIDFREYLKDSKNILLVEWSNKAKKFLPKKYFLFKLRHAGGDKREIKFYA